MAQMNAANQNVKYTYLHAIKVSSFQAELGFISFETSFPLLPTHCHIQGWKMGVLLPPCQGFTAEWAEGLR